MKIKPDSSITFHFRLSLEDGTVLESTFEKAPAVLTLGQETLPEAYEKCLIGLSLGDEKSFELGPDEGFAPHQAANVQQLPLAKFTALQDTPPQIGTLYHFNDALGFDCPGVVVAVTEKIVTIDFNHPLSGKATRFDVQILDVQYPEKPLLIKGAS